MLARQALQAAHLPQAWLGLQQFGWLTTATHPGTSTQQQQQQPPGPAGSSPEEFVGSFKSPPASLQFPRGQVTYPPLLEGNILGRALLTALGAYSRKQQLRNGAALMYNAITEAAENEQLQRAVGLDPSLFMTSHNMLVLHMWLVINRLHDCAAQGDAQVGKDAASFRQMLYQEFFFKDVERRVYAHGVTVHVSKWVKKLEQQFYGSCMAYDLALRKEEGGVTAQQAAFVAALLKNVYDGDAERRPWAVLLSRYLLREGQCLQQTELDSLFSGQIRFSDDILVGGKR